MTVADLREMIASLPSDCDDSTVSVRDGYICIDGSDSHGVFSDAWRISCADCGTSLCDCGECHHSECFLSAPHTINK